MTGRTPGEHAQAYAAHGWPVFPCRPGSKEPATRHGFLDATTDPGRITWWWRRYPDANVAIATGMPGPDVLDVDQHHAAGNGFAALNRLLRAGLARDSSAVVATPSGGQHLYYAGSGQRSGKLPGHHLDFKAAGGYVLAPPSQIGGRPYRLAAHRAGAAGLEWAAVTRLLEPARHLQNRPAGIRGTDPGRLAGWVAKLEEGNRNDGLFWAACRATETGRHDLLAGLADAARTAGLGDREITATLASARRTTGRSAEPHPEREGTP